LYDLRALLATLQNQHYFTLKQNAQLIQWLGECCTGADPLKVKEDEKLQRLRKLEKLAAAVQTLCSFDDATEGIIGGILLEKAPKRRRKRKIREHGRMAEDAEKVSSAEVRALVPPVKIDDGRSNNSSDWYEDKGVRGDLPEHLSGDGWYAEEKVMPFQADEEAPKWTPRYFRLNTLEDTMDTRDNEDTAPPTKSDTGTPATRRSKDTGTPATRMSKDTGTPATRRSEPQSGEESAESDFSPRVVMGFY